MLKKLLTISLAFLYLLVSSGLLVEIHHCMGRIADASLHVFAHETDDDTCGKCGMPKTEEYAHCCKDEVKLVKVDDDQKASGIFYQLDAPVAIIQALPWQEWMEPESSLQAVVLPPSHGPPLTETNSFQSLYCIFRI